MAIKQPGTTSSTQLLTTLFWSLIMVVILIGGHLTMAFLIYSNFTDGKGMLEVAEFTSLPTWALWLSVVAALALDSWILFHQRKDRKEALSR